MPAPSDRVQVIKQESTAGGGDAADADPFYSNEVIDETEDALSAAGLFVQDQAGPADEAAGIWRESGTLKAKDPTYGTVDLLAGAAGSDDKRAKVSAGDTTPGYLEEKVVAGPGLDVAVLNDDTDEQLEIRAGLRRHFLLMGA